jgi:hypothetical protein
MDKKSQIQQNESEIILETMSENMFKIQLRSKNQSDLEVWYLSLFSVTQY